MATINGTNRADVLTGTSQNDTINGRDGDDKISAGAGNDIVSGGGGNDVIDGGIGNDKLSGDGGRDTISGGDGSDTILGGADADNLSGDAGDDYVDGGAGNDVISGGIGNDTLIGGSGSNSISGGDGNDSITGGKEGDLLVGDEGDDKITGGGGIDKIYGGSGNDTLTGGSTTDVISGDAGNDTIDGSGGNDILVGGEGNDQIKGGAGNDCMDGGDGIDTAIYAGKSIYYQITFNADNSVTVTGLEGTDKLYNFEFVKFADQTINITPNTPPTALDVLISGSEDTATPVTLLATDNTSIASFSLTSLPTNGTLYLNPEMTAAASANVFYPASGNALTLYFKPDANFFGDVSFTFTAKDTAGAIDSTPALATIQVAPINDAPVAVADSNSTTEDGSPFPIGNLIANDFDIENNALHITQYSTVGTYGTLFVTSSGDYSYTLNQPLELAQGETRTDSFSYTISDGSLTSTSQLTITINGINDAPVANSDSIIRTEDGPFTGNVLANDTDVDSSLTVADGYDSAGIYGSLQISSSGDFVYTPYGTGLDFLGEGDSRTESFNYTATDGSLSHSSTLTITINGVNDAPVAVADNNTMTQNDASVSGNILSNDFDPDSQFFVENSGTFPLTYGTLGLDPFGNYTYTLTNPAIIALPEGGFVEEIYSYRANDGSLSSNLSQLTIRINGLNDAPIANPDFNSVTEDAAAASGNVLINDTDPDTGASLSVTGNETAGLYGTLQISTLGEYIYTLGVPGSSSFDFDSMAPGDTFTDSFDYTISDGITTHSSTLTITISGVNDAPVAVADNNTLTQNEASVSGNILSNDFDPDSQFFVENSGTFPLTYGTLGLDPFGNYTYTLTNPAIMALAEGEFVEEVYSYRANDGSLSSNLSQLTIRINGLNDAPVANEDFLTITEDNLFTSAHLLINDTDIDNGTTLVATAETLVGSHGTLLIDESGAYVYQLGVFPDSTISFDFMPAGQTLTDTFTYTVSDGMATDSSTLTITIQGVNDAPIAFDDSNSITENGVTIAGNVIANDFDAEGGLRVASELSLSGTYGDFFLDVSGTYNYNLNGTDLEYLAAGQTVTDTFSYTITDGALTDTGTLTITIVGENDAPVANTDSITRTEDEAPFTGNVLANDVDVDSSSLTVAPGYDSMGTYGSLSISTLGEYIYTPYGSSFDFLREGETRTDVFNYTATDGSLSDSSTLTITVTGVNDGPTAVEDLYSVHENATTPLAGNILDNDMDIDNPEGFRILSLNASPTPYGTLTLGTDGFFMYTPNVELPEGEIREDIYTYTMTDGYAVSSAQITFTIIGQNDAPVAVDDVGEMFENDAAATGNVLTNDTDVDNPQDLIVGDYQRLGTYGSIEIQLNGDYVYTLAGTGVDYLAEGEPLTDQFTYLLVDGEKTDEGLLTITITGVNDGPTAVEDLYSVHENATTPLAGNILDNDMDIDNPEDFRILSLNASPTPYGTLTLGTDGFFMYTPNVELPEGEIREDIYTYTMTDGYAVSSAQITFTIIGQNDAPVAVDDVDAMFENDAAATGNVLINDTDVDNPQDLIVGDYQRVGTYGSIEIQLNGDYVYTPAGSGFDYLAEGEALTDQFTYLLVDGEKTDEGLLTITINGVNDAPVAVADSDSMTENDAAATGNVLTNDFDVDGDALHVTTVTPFGLYGTLVMDLNGNYTYIPNVGSGLDYLAEGQIVSDTLSYTISDGSLTNTADLTITIVGKNDAPVANPDSITRTEDEGPFTGNVLANDVDVDNVLTVAPDYDSTGTYGSLTISSLGGFVYTPYGTSLDFLGEGESITDIFNYTATDGSLSNSSTLTITINGVNDAPNVVEDSISIQEDSATSQVSGNVLINDNDPDNADIFVVVENGNALTIVEGTFGTLSLAPNGNYTYQLDPAFELAAGQVISDQLHYRVTDGLDESIATFNVTLTGVNDAPVATADFLALSEDATSATGNVLLNDYDPEGFVIRVPEGGYESVSGTGTLQIDAGGNFIYTRDVNINFDFLRPGESVTDSFDYTVTDGLVSRTSTLTLTFHGVNDAPVVVAETLSIEEDSAAVSGNVLINDDDPDSVDIFVVDSLVEGEYGTLSLAPNGNYTYQLDPAFELGFGQLVTETLFYRVTDGSAESLASFHILLSGVNDAPIPLADARTITEDATSATGNVLNNDVDPDGFSLFVPEGGYDTVGSIGVGTLQISESGDYIYTRTSNLDFLKPGEIMTDTFDYTASDGLDSRTSTLSFTITGVNDAPHTVEESISIVEDGAASQVSGNVLLNDSDPENDSIQVVINGTQTIVQGIFGTLYLSANGDYTYQLDPSFELAEGDAVADSLLYRVTDGSLESVGNFIIFLTGVNDAPDAEADTQTITEDETTATGNVLTNDVDPDSLSMFVPEGGYDIVGSAGLGLLHINEAGDYVYTRNGDVSFLKPGEIMTDSFDYTVSDGSKSSTSTLSITITGVNDAPEAVADTNSMDENDGQVTGNALANDTDPEGDTLHVEGVTPFGIFGTLLMDIDGNYTYTTYATGLDFLGVGESATDTFSYSISDGLLSSFADLTITIFGVNDAPSDLALSNSSVTENAAGAVIGTVIVSDLDNNDTHTFEVDDTRFEIVDGELKLKDGESLDYEQASVVPLEILVRDRNGATFVKNFNINVIDSLGILASSYIVVDYNTLPASELQESLYLTNDADNIVTLPTAERAAEIGYAATTVFSGGAGNDVISGSGNLGINYNIDGGEGNDYIIAGGGSNTMSGSSGTDTVSYEYNLTGVTINLASGSASAGTATDTLSGFENVVGSLGGDTIVGDANDNDINGMTGNDEISGDAGNDSIAGGDGSDTLNGGDGDDVVSGGPGDDIIAGGMGEDLLFGNEGKDKFQFTEGKKTFDGGEDTDSLTGEGAEEGVTFDLTGAVFNFTSATSATGTPNPATVSNIEDLVGSNFGDILRGDSFDNMLTGLSGDDIFEGKAGNDTFVGGDGTDQAVYNNAAGDYSYTNISGVLSIFGPEGNDVLTGVESLTFGGGTVIDVATLLETAEQVAFS